MFWVEMLGYIAGLLTLINMFPQVLKTYRLKRAKDVSFYMVLTYTLSMVFWVAYAYFIVSWPIMITNSIAGLMGLIQMSLMYKYKKK